MSLSSSVEAPRKRRSKKSDASRPLWAKLLAAVVVVFALWCLVSIAKLGLADVAAYQLEYKVEQWAGEDRPPNAEEIEWGLAQIESALSWEPHNPTYLELKALLHLYDSLAHWNTDEFIGKSQAALTTYREASRIRPKWAYTWARIAQVKSHQRIYDAEFNRAIENAVRYGPWEPQVHVAVADAGMFGWDFLTPEMQSLVAANVYRGIKRQARAIKPLADRYGVRYLVCAKIPFDKRSQKFCR